MSFADAEVKAAKPLLAPDGSLYQCTLKIGGQRFRCACDCNVFHHPDDQDLNCYECNACGQQFETGD